MSTTTSRMKNLWHNLACPITRRWLRRRIRMPFWRDDKTAQILGIASFGCHRCGRGAIEERDRHQRILDAINEQGQAA